MFNINKYNKYIETIEKRIHYYYVFSFGIFTIIGAYTKGITGMIIGIIIGLLISNYLTLNLKIKIERMKWEIDIYKKIVN